MIIGHNPLVNVINWRIVIPGGPPPVDNAHRPRILFPLPSAILYWGLMPRGSGGVVPSTGLPQNRQFLADVGFLMGR